MRNGEEIYLSIFIAPSFPSHSLRTTKKAGCHQHLREFNPQSGHEDFGWAMLNAFGVVLITRNTIITRSVARPRYNSGWDSLVRRSKGIRICRLKRPFATASPTRLLRLHSRLVREWTRSAILCKASSGHRRGRVKATGVSVIFLFRKGGPHTIDTFDHEAESSGGISR